MKFKVGDHVTYNDSRTHLGVIINYNKVESDIRNHPIYVIEWINVDMKYDHDPSESFVGWYPESHLREVV